jgi:pSer/pThr/pTyr-binding forkhead associated (FHA) protein
MQATITDRAARRDIAMVEKKPSISLTIQLKNGNTKVLEFNTNDPIMIGSGASSHVRLDGDEVSSLHCMLKPRDGKVYVLDLGSDDGTQLNNKDLDRETALEDGDNLKIGGARITVHFGGDMLAPTVPIRRHDMGHGNAGDEATMPLQEAPPQKAPPRAVTPPPAASDLRKDVVVEKIAAKPVEKVADKAPEKTPEPKKPLEQSVATEVVRERKIQPPAKTATSMEPRVKQRELSQSGFKLGKSAAPAYRKIGDSKPTDLSTTLPSDQKPTDKRDVDVSVVWGSTVIGNYRIKSGENFNIGRGEGVTFKLSHESLTAPSFAVVKSGAGGVQLASPGGQVLINDKPSSSGTLELGDVGKVVVGPVEFVVQYAKRSPLLLAAVSEVVDFFYAKILAIALILQVGLAIALMITPNFGSLDDDDLFKNQQDFTQLILAAQEKKKEKKEELSGKKADRHKNDEGTFGKKDKPKEDKMASKKGAPTVDKDKREEDRKIVMDQLAALGLTGPTGAVSNVFGPGGVGSGVNNALGGLKGSSMGDAGGAGGMGVRGTGAGGGGTGLGIGGLGSGNGRGSGGDGNIDLGGRGKGSTRIIPGKIIYEGGLSKEEIQRVISRVMSQIKYCYDKELTRDPNLEGKLAMFWTITGTGDVTGTSAAQNTFSGPAAPAIEQCVQRIIARLKFPSPKGGGVVSVTYPFNFAGSGGG